MISTAQKTGHTTSGREKKEKKKGYPAAFSKYRFYLDIKASKVKTSLIEDITALGGTLVEFLTKEVSHVISEGPEWKFLLVSSGACGPPSPWTPMATPSPWTPGASPSPATSTSLDGEKNKKAKSRVESILATSKKKERNSGSSDVLDIAKRFKCHIWSLNKTLAWLTKFKAKYGSLNTSKSTPKVKERVLQEPYIKLDSSIRYAKPAFAELKSWPKIGFEGWAGSSPFCQHKKKLKRKNLTNRLRLDFDKKEEKVQAKKDCPKKKEGGFCEICNKTYSELERHLNGEAHRKFVNDSSNWTEIDVTSADSRDQAARDLLF